jgi:hypothetical protein
MAKKNYDLMSRNSVILNVLVGVYILLLLLLILHLRTNFMYNLATLKQANKSSRRLSSLNPLVRTLYPLLLLSRLHALPLVETYRIVLFKL